ncbi:hypothetical protein KA183_21585, partial [bacterium]|nr:hypothetical protein [bacterium]
PRTPQAVDSINLATVSVQIPTHLILSQWTRSDSGLNQYQQLRKGQLSKYVGSYPEERQGCSKYATAIKFFQFPGDQRHFYCMGSLPSLGDSNPFAALFGSDLAANSIHLIAPDSSATEMRIAEYSSEFYQSRISQEVCTGTSLDVSATLGDALDAYGYYPNEYKACAREGRDTVIVSIALSFGQTEIVYTEQKTLRRGTWDQFEVLGQMIALVRDTVR